MTDTPAEREDSSIWAELRRRRVVQWTLAYAAGAWVLLQVLGFVSDSFAWPATVKQIATILLAIGLPIVVVLGWYHGDRGQQRVTGPELAVLTLLLLIGGGLLWLYAQRSVPTAATPAAVRPAPTSAATDARPSIAVLPFENRSDVQKDAFFVDGIHDDILTQLSKVGALKVISRTSVERFRSSDLSLQQIAQQLRVTSILEGGVQRAGDRVRVNVQLIDAATDAHLWAETYDRELTAVNIFAIQSEVAAAIAGALKAALTPGEQARIDAIPTQNLEAWQAYQLGKHRLAKRNSAALIEAEEHFRKAITLDPRFALAWAGLAEALAVQAFYGGRPRDLVLGDAEQAVAKSLELDPDLAEARVSAGLIAHFRLQFERAEEMFRKAITLNPNFAPAHHGLNVTLLNLGRRDEALAQAERAVALDPLSALINNWLGSARMNVGRFDDALVAFQQAIELDPTMASAYSHIGDVQAHGFGRLDTAMAWYEKASSLDPGNPEYPAALAARHWDLGNDGEAGRWLDRALALGEGTANTNRVAALLYLDRGEEALARRHALRAAEVDPGYMYPIRDHDLRKGDYTTARARYAKAFPELFATELPKLTDRAAFATIALAPVLQLTGEGERAEVLLDRGEAHLRTVPRMGRLGYGISDVAIYALRGERTMALAKLREAERAGWRGRWRYARDFDPELASIRNAPEFKAVFADIERDMAQQRAALAARPKDAPLELSATAH